MAIPPTTATRAQLFFNDGRMEWSEIYWKPPGTDINAALADAVTALAPVRVQLLAKGVQLSEIRVSVDNVFRDSLIDTSYANWGRGDPGQQLYNLGLAACPKPAAPTTCLRMREESSPIYRRIMFLSGIPDAVVIDQGNWNAANMGCPPWNIAMQNWIGYLADPATSWGFVVTVNPVMHQSVVTGATRTNPSDPITVTTADNIPWVSVGRTFTIHNARNSGSCLKLNGRHVVASMPAPNSVTYFDPTSGPVCYAFNGLLESVDLTWAKINHIIPDGFSIRKRGAAELAPRGRSRVRRRFGT